MYSSWKRRVRCGFTGKLRTVFIFFTDKKIKSWIRILNVKVYDFFLSIFLVETILVFYRKVYIFPVSKKLLTGYPATHWPDIRQNPHLVVVPVEEEKGEGEHEEDEEDDHPAHHTWTSLLQGWIKFLIPPPRILMTNQKSV